MRSSSLETDRLTPDADRPSKSAARVKLPLSTTAASTVTPDNNLPSYAIGYSALFSKDEMTY
jgi:hypothetical protein